MSYIICTYREKKWKGSLNKRILFCKPAKFATCPNTNLEQRSTEKQTHLIFFCFEKSCEVDLSLECQYFPFPIFSEFENSPTGPLTTTLTFPPVFFSCLASSIPVLGDFGVTSKFKKNACLFKTFLSTMTVTNWKTLTETRIWNYDAKAVLHYFNVFSSPKTIAV